MNLPEKCLLAVLLALHLGSLPLGAQQPPAKATRYLEMLRQKPQFGVVFERFLDAWYEESSAEELARHLASQAGKPDAKAGDHLLLALFKARQGAELEAVAAFQKGLALQPANASAWLELARLQVRILDFASALRSLEEALRQQPESALRIAIAKYRGSVLLRTGRPEDALAAWRKLLEENPDDEDLAEEVIDAQTDEGLYTEAVRTCTALIERTKEPYLKVTRRLRLAEIHLRAGNKKEALEQLAETLRQSGADTWLEGEALSRIERIFREEDNLTGLVAHLESLAASEPLRVVLKQHLARACTDAGDKDKALAVYRDLLERTPGKRSLREGYLDLLERLERYDDAIIQARELITQNPGDQELLLRLAALQQGSGDAKGASKTLDDYLSSKDAGEYEHLRVARLLEQWGLKSEARAVYERMVAALTGSVSVREAQAIFLHRIGDRDAAISIWKDLAAKGSEDEVINVAQALIARQEGTAALQVLTARVSEFGKDPRYLAPLLLASITSRQYAPAIPWALDRVRLTADTALLDDAIRQAMQVLAGAQATVSTLKELRAQPALSFPERALLAALLEESGEREAAEKLLREASPADATSAQARLVALVETRQDWPRAAQEMEKLIAMPGGRTSEHLQRLVNLRQKAGEPTEALKLIPDWKVLSPGAVQPWLVESGLLIQLGKPQESLKVLRTAARKFEDDTTLTAALANAYVEAGQYADAEHIYLGLLERSDSVEDRIRWVGALAQASVSRNELKSLTEKFQERQRKNREDAAPWLMLSEIARVAGNQVEQRRCLLEASRLRPKDVDLLHQIARVEEESGNYRQALQTLEQAFKLGGGPRTRQAMAMTNLRSGDEQTGFRMLQELMGGDDMEPKDALRLADAMMARTQWEKAAELLRPLVKKHPDDYRLRYQLAVALFDTSELDAAMAEFLQVAIATRELPEVLKNPPLRTSAASEEYYNRMRRTSPPGLVEVMRVVRHVYDVTQHRRNMRQSSSSSGVKLPSDVEQARAYAVLNLLFLVEDNGGEKRGKIVDWLQQHGRTECIPVMYLETNTRASWSVSMPEDVLAAHPDDLLMHALNLSLQGGFEQSGMSVETGKRTYHLLREKYPMLAFQAAAVVARQDLSEGSALLHEALDRMSRLPELEPELPDYIGATLGVSSNIDRSRSAEVDFPEDIKRKIVDLMIRSMENQTLVRNGYLNTNPIEASNVYRLNKRWDAYVALWERIIKQARTEGPATRKAMSLASYQTSTGLLKPIPFPVSDSLPDMFSLMMRYVDPFNPQVGSYYRAGPEEDFAGVVPFLDKITEPDLRLALAHKADRKDLVKAELETRLAKPQPTADDLLLAAGHASLSEEPARAAELLVRLSALPLEAVRRAQVDAAIVDAVMQLQPIPAPLLEPARQAARRLRSPKLDGRQRTELAGVFEKFGLKEEAEQWNRLAALLPTTSRAVYRSYSPQGTGSQLEQAIKKGNTTEAVRAVTFALRDIRSEYWQGSSSWARDQGRTLMRKVTFEGAKEKIIAALDPGAGASVGRREEFAAHLEIAGYTPEAIKVYEELAEKHPTAYSVRLRLMAVVAPKDSARAAKLLAEVPPKAFNMDLGSLVLESFSNASDSLSGRTGMLNAISAMLERFAEDPQAATLRTQLDWLVDLPPMAGRRSYSPNPLPFLYGTRTALNLSGTPPLPDDHALAKQRRESVERLCKAMMLHPRLAAEGFRWHAAMHLASGGDPEALAPLATTLVEKCRQYRSAGGALIPLPARRNYTYEEVEGAWRPSPVEFLAWRAWKQGRPEQITSELLPVAMQFLERNHYNLVKAGSTVLTCEPEAFATMSENYMRATTTARGSSNSVLIGEALAWLTDRWDERNIPGPVLDKVVLSTLSRFTSSNDGYFLPMYLKVRSRLAPEDNVENLFQTYFTNALGPKSGWQTRMIAYANYRYGRGSYDQQAYRVGMLISRLADIPDTKPLAARLAVMVGIMEHEQWRNNSFFRTRDSITTNAKLSVALLEGVGFLSEAPEFNCYSNFTSFFSALRSAKAVRGEVLAALKARKQQTFGVELAQALLHDNVPEALSAFVQHRSADFASIPAARLPQTGLLIRGNLPAASRPDTLSPALRKALTPLLDVEIKTKMLLSERWLAAGRFKDLDMRMDLYETEVIRVTQDLAATDRTKAAAFFDHACRLMEQEEQTSGWTSTRPGNGWTLRSALLEAAMKESPKMPMLGLAMKLFHDDATGNLTMSGWSDSSGWGPPLMEAWKNAGGLGNMDRGGTAMLTSLAKEMAGTPHTLLPLAFYDLYAKLPKSQRPAMLRWALSPERPDSLKPLLQELALAGRFFLGTDASMRGDPEMQKALAEMGGLAPVWEHEEARLGNEDLNPRARLALAQHLCHRAPRLVTEKIASQGADLALSAQRKRHCMHGYQYGVILQAWCRQPADDAWKVLAQAHWSAWQSRVAFQTKSQTLRYVPHFSPTMSMLRTVSRAGLDTAVSSILSQYEEELGEDATGFAILVREGRNAEATTLLKVNWPTLASSAFDKLILWDATMPVAVEKFCQDCGDPDLAFAGELLLSTIPDVPKPEQALTPGFVDRGRRQVNLARRLATTPFGNEALKKHCIQELAGAHHVVELLGTALEGPTSEITWGDSISDGNGTEALHQAAAAFAVAIGKLWKGDSKPVMTLLDRLLTDPTAGTYYNARVISQGILQTTKASEWKWSRTPGSDMAPMLAFADHVLAKCLDRVQSDEAGRIIGLKLLMHHLMGHPEAVAAWKKSMTVDQEQKMQQAFASTFDLWTQCRMLTGDAKPRVSAEERAALATTLLKDSWVARQYEANNGSLIAALVDRGKLFTTAEFQTVWKSLAEAAPRNGRTATESADKFVQEGMYEDAVAALGLAVSQSGKDLNIAAARTLRKVELLELLQRREEAVNLATALDEKSLNAAMKAQRQTWLSRLGGAKQE